MLPSTCIGTPNAGMDREKLQPALPHTIFACISFLDRDHAKPYISRKTLAD